MCRGRRIINEAPSLKVTSRHISIGACALRSYGDVDSQKVFSALRRGPARIQARVVTGIMTTFQRAANNVVDLLCSKSLPAARLSVIRAQAPSPTHHDVRDEPAPSSRLEGEHARRETWFPAATHPRHRCTRSGRTRDSGTEIKLRLHAVGHACDLDCASFIPASIALCLVLYRLIDIWHPRLCYGLVDPSTARSVVDALAGGCPEDSKGAHRER